MGKSGSRKGIDKRHVLEYTAKESMFDDGQPQGRPWGSPNWAGKAIIAKNGK